jgi:hypothetical protein
MQGRSGLRAAGAALLVFAALLFGASAPSAASSYTLAFTGTVTGVNVAAGSAFQALGIVAGDSVSGILKFDPFNADTYTMADAVTHAFAQSASMSFQVSHPGEVLSFTENGVGTAYSGRTTSPGNTQAGIAFDFTGGDDYLHFFYLTDGNLTALTSLAALPASSSDIIAFLGGGSPEASGQFNFGALSGLNFEIALTTATTPIPPALPLFVSALGGLGFMTWRRRAVKRPGGDIGALSA